MTYQNIPEIFTRSDINNLDMFVYDYKMTDDVFNSKVNLNLHMFSFLIKGEKQVHFADTSITVNNKQSLLIKKGNCLWSEMLVNDAIYYCKLFFFSDNRLKEFIKNNHHSVKSNGRCPSYFVIENDDYILSYLNTLSNINNITSNAINNLLSCKFDELMLYLINKYGNAFEQYLQSLITKESTSTLKQVIENNIYTNLKIEDIAFLCHMSLSTFKRNFITEYKTSPGKWLKEKRLERAKELLESGQLKPSEIYLEFGYKNLSNFSAAFKNKFGKSPQSIRL